MPLYNTIPGGLGVEVSHTQGDAAKGMGIARMGSMGIDIFNVGLIQRSCNWQSIFTRNKVARLEGRLAASEFVLLTNPNPSSQLKRMREPNSTKLPWRPNNLMNQRLLIIFSHLPLLTRLGPMVIGPRVVDRQLLAIDSSIFYWSPINTDSRDKAEACPSQIGTKMVVML